MQNYTGNNPPLALHTAPYGPSPNYATFNSPPGFNSPPQAQETILPNDFNAMTLQDFAMGKLIEVEGFENFVNEVWHEALVDSSNAMINQMNKLKYLKKKIRVWNGMRHNSKNRKHVLKQELADLEMVIDKGDASVDIMNKRMEVVKSIQELDKLYAIEATQKAKIKWAIEGDENSNYYHGILNKKRNQLSIRGVLVDGNWVESPDVVKNEFLTHFKKRFERPQKVRPILNMVFPHQLNSMQQ
ncbi:hypothetical protein Tco_1489568, partial [Tanacetum coccineum]